MSKKAQQEDIQIVSDRATENLNGLYLFQNGMPNKAEKKEMRLKALIQPCKDLQLAALERRIMKDRRVRHVLGNYVCMDLC
jgi:hypothetical protein